MRVDFLENKNSISSANSRRVRRTIKRIFLKIITKMILYSQYITIKEAEEGGRGKKY
jgi:hypothetical protein